MLASYRQIFRHRGFALFWLGLTCSSLGDAMTRVALTWFVYEQTGSSQALGLLVLAYGGPVVVGGLLAGWLLDRFDRRSVLAIDSVIRGLAVLSLPILHALGRLPVWYVYVVAAVYGLLMMISLAGSPALVPSLVPREALATANALETLGYSVANIAGPALGGWLIAQVGAINVVLVDAASYFAFALALLRLPVRPAAETARAAAPDTLRFADAARLLFGNRVLFSTTGMFLTFNIGLGGLFVLLPIYADQILGGDARLFGSLLGALAAGEVASALLVGSLGFRLSLGLLICLSQVLAGVALSLLLFGSRPLAFAGLVLFGVSARR